MPFHCPLVPEVYQLFYNSRGMGVKRVRRGSIVCPFGEILWTPGHRVGESKTEKIQQGDKTESKVSRERRRVVWPEGN